MDELLKVTGIGKKLAKQLLKLIDIKLNIFDQLMQKKIFEQLPVAAQTFLRYRPENKVLRNKFIELEKLLGNNAIIAGSFRRENDTINDLDILTNNFSLIPTLLEKPYSEGEEIIKTYYEFEPKRFIEVDIFIYKDLAPYLLFATGSKKFNVIMRGLAKRKGYTLNQHGLFLIKNNEKEKLDLASEKDIFEKLGMNYIPPKNRNLI